MVGKIRLAAALLLCALVALIPLSGIKESFRVQNVEKTAMVKSIGFDSAAQSTISYVASVIDDSSAFHSQCVIRAQAEGFTEAEKKAQILADKYLSFAYAKHFIIGLPTAQGGIDKILDFLLASPVLQLSSYIYLSDTPAADMLESISQDSISTNEVLSNLNLAGKEEGYYVPVTVLECARAVQEHRCIALPIIGQAQEGKNTAKKSVPVFKGYALLGEGKLRAVLPLRLARAYNLLSNQLSRTVVSCGDCDITLTKARCKTDFEREGERVKRVRLRLRLVGEFAAVSKGSLADEALVQAYTAQEEQILLAEMRELLAFLEQKQLDALDWEGALERQSGGKVTNAKAALAGAPVSITMKQQQERSFTLNSNLSVTN